MSPFVILVVIIYTERPNKMDMEKDPEYKLFDGLLKQHMGLIRTLCWWHSSCSESTCKELVQDCCVSIWSHLSSLREDSNPLQQMAWVTWQCQSVFSHRHRHKDPDWLSIDDRLADTVADNSSTDHRELLEELAVGLTPTEYRLLTFTLEGYSGKEIAEKLGMTVGAVKKMRQRIISKMAKKTQKI